MAKRQKGSWFVTLLERAVHDNHSIIWDVLGRHSRQIHNLEVHMSLVDDELAKADEVTNEIAADLDALAAQLADGKSKAEKDAADKIRAHTDRLRGVAAKYPVVESDEPVADGEPLPDGGSPQTVPVEGGNPAPVSNFPAEDVNEDGAPETSGDVSAPAAPDNGSSSDQASE